MDSVDMHRMQENEAYGCWLIHAIGDRIGCGTNINLIKKAIYKGTDCGAWVEFDSEGIIVGTIVEGSDSSYSERINLAGIDDCLDPDAELNRRFWAALQNCENFANEVFGEMNDIQSCE